MSEVETVNAKQIIADSERFGEMAHRIYQLEQQLENALNGLTYFSNQVDEKNQQLAEANKVIDSKQAKIDALMLEYCPDEMTYEQMQEWEDSQRIVGHPPFIEDDREYWLEPIDYIKWRDYTYFLTNCLDL